VWLVTVRTIRSTEEVELVFSLSERKTFEDRQSGSLLGDLVGASTVVMREVPEETIESNDVSLGYLLPERLDSFYFGSQYRITIPAIWLIGRTVPFRGSITFVAKIYLIHSYLVNCMLSHMHLVHS
jgi:hypothetical protein